MLTLTPQSRAIAAFTLAVLLVFGPLNKIVYAIVLTFGTSYPDGRGGHFLTGLILIALSGLVTAFAMNSVGLIENPAGWENHLARAAVVVAAVGMVIAILLTIGLVANNNGSPNVFAPGIF